MMQARPGNPNPPGTFRHAGPFAVPLEGDEGLATEGTRVRLAGPIEELRYPPLCPSCGARAGQPLTFSKVFWRGDSGDGPSFFHLTAASPLFCSPCIAAHVAERRVPTPFEVLRTVWGSQDARIAAAMLPLALFAIFRLSAGLSRWPVALVCSLPILVGLAKLRSAWQKTWCLRVPAQTRITRAFDFGDDSGGSRGFSTTPRTYVIRNPGYATAFEQLNAARSAHFLSPEQKALEKADTLSANLWVLAIFLVVASAILLISWLSAKGH